MSTTPLKARLTQRLVDSAAPTSDGEFRIWDASVRGFFLRVWPGGRKTYCLRRVLAELWEQHYAAVGFTRKVSRGWFDELFKGRFPSLR